MIVKIVAKTMKDHLYFVARASNVRLSLSLMFVSIFESWSVLTTEKK